MELIFISLTWSLPLLAILYMLDSVRKDIKKLKRETERLYIEIYEEPDDPEPFERVPEPVKNHLKLVG